MQQEQQQERAEMKAAWYYPNDKHINQWRAQNRPVLSTDFF